MSRPIATPDGLIYGASPRVSLLPPQIKEAQNARAVRGRLFFGLALAVLVVLFGVGAASFSVMNANRALASEQTRTAQLLVQMGKYSSVTSAQTQVTDIKTAQPVAASGEIIWSEFSAGIDATLPSGTTISGINARLDATNTAAETPVPLQGAHIATVVLTAESPQATISDWLDQLGRVKGVVDATPGTVALDDGIGRYTVTVTLHLDSAAVANQYGKVK